MRKYVYLFELDSVRKTDADIIAGQKALYDEIHGIIEAISTSVCSCYGLLKDCERKHFYGNK